MFNWKLGGSIKVKLQFSFGIIEAFSSWREFISRWEEKLSLQTKIKKGSFIDYNDWLFFDIKPIELDTSRARFSYNYSSVEQIYNGLVELDKILKFITQDTPNKKQKRNDYED